MISWNVRQAKGLWHAPHVNVGFWVYLFIYTFLHTMPLMIQLISSLLIFSLELLFSSLGMADGFGIESMRSQSYSVGIFVFMMVSMLVFVGVIVLFYKHTDMSSVKTGEKVLMAMIVLGVIVAAIFAAVQLLDGYLI